jgi:hypothetical protein
MSDRIVYLVVSNGGGVDGRDHTDKGGKILHANLIRDVAERKVNSWSHLKPTVQDLDEILTNIKPTPLEKLALNVAAQEKFGSPLFPD